MIPRRPVTILGAHSASPLDRPSLLRRHLEERQVVGLLEVADCRLLPLFVGEVQVLVALVDGARGWDRAAHPLQMVVALEVHPYPYPFEVSTLAAYWVVASCPAAYPYLAASHSDPGFTRVHSCPAMGSTTSGHHRHRLHLVACLAACLEACLVAYWVAVADYTAESGS